jgi:hypothetical protein
VRAFAGPYFLLFQGGFFETGASRADHYEHLEEGDEPSSAAIIAAEAGIFFS